MKITRELLSTAPRAEVLAMKKELEVSIEKLNTFFDSFLENTDLRADDTTTVEWQIYNEMMKDYDRVDQLIRTANYYLGSHA